MARYLDIGLCERLYRLDLFEIPYFPLLCYIR
jgi:hypothetical protein